MPIQEYNNEYWLEIVLRQTDKSGSTRILQESFKSGFDGWSWYQRMRPSIAKKKRAVVENTDGQPSQTTEKKKKNKNNKNKDVNLTQKEGFASYGVKNEENN